MRVFLITLLFTFLSLGTLADEFKCVEGMLKAEVEKLEKLMLQEQIERCKNNPDNFIPNKCKRTCFTDYKKIDKDPDSQRDEFWDKFTRGLIKEGAHYTISDPKLGKISIVVQDAYLTESEVSRYCENLTDNLKKAMEMLGEEKAPEGLTIYLYGKDIRLEPKIGYHSTNPHDVDLGKSPPSYGNAVGLKKGSKGLAMAFSRTEGDPTIHEFVHLLTLHQMDSESLSEGLPEYIQYKVQPDMAVGINAREGVKDPDEEALKLIEQFESENQSMPSYVKSDCKPVNILTTIGSNYLPRFVLKETDKVKHENCYLNINRDPIGLKPGNVVVLKERYRKGFYHASHSFIKYLVEEEGGMKKFMNLYGEGGTPQAYELFYGEDVDSLRKKWIAHIKSKKATSNKK